MVAMSVALPSGKIRMRSIAPSTAFMPWRIWYPSKAGPEAQLVTVTRPSCTRAISVLVPMSMAIDGRFLPASLVAAITARASEPTNPAIGGGKCTPPSGCMSRPSCPGRRVSGSARAGANGAAPRPTGESPRARWCIAVLATMVMSHTCTGSMPQRSYRRPRHASIPSAHHLGELGPRRRLERLRHARDDVLAEAHLRVLDSLVIDQRAPREVEEVGDDLRGADVDGDAVESRRLVAWVDGDHAPLVQHRDQAPICLARQSGRLWMT